MKIPAETSTSRSEDSGDKQRLLRQQVRSSFGASSSRHETDSRAFVSVSRSLGSCPRSAQKPHTELLLRDLGHAKAGSWQGRLALPCRRASPTAYLSSGVELHSSRGRIRSYTLVCQAT